MLEINVRDNFSLVTSEDIRVDFNIDIKSVSNLKVKKYGFGIGGQPKYFMNNFK